MKTKIDDDKIFVSTYYSHFINQSITICYYPDGVLYEVFSKKDDELCFDEWFETYTEAKNFFIDMIREIELLKNIQFGLMELRKQGQLII